MEKATVSPSRCPLLSDVPFVATREHSCCFPAPAVPKMGGGSSSRASAPGQPGPTPLGEGHILSSGLTSLVLPLPLSLWLLNSQDSEVCSAKCGLRDPLCSFPLHIQAFLSLS